MSESLRRRKCVVSEMGISGGGKRRAGRVIVEGGGGGGGGTGTCATSAVGSTYAGQRVEEA